MAHDNETKFNTWVETKLLREAEEVIKKNGYKSLTEFFREKLRETIKEDKG